MHGKSPNVVVQPAQKSNQSQFEQEERVFQGEGLERKTKRPMIEKVEGMSYKKKKKGNYMPIPFQIKVRV